MNNRTAYGAVAVVLTLFLAGVIFALTQATAPDVEVGPSSPASVSYTDCWPDWGATMTDDDPVPIDGGFHVKDLPDGRCIDVMQQLYNWRLVICSNRRHNITTSYEHGWCSFGHGSDSQGRPRNMSGAFLAAMAAAIAWDGQGTPPGYDKEAF